MLSKDLLQQFEDNITRFDENIHAFENGEIDRQTFKGISGCFPSRWTETSLSSGCPEWTLRMS